MVACTAFLVSDGDMATHHSAQAIPTAPLGPWNWGKSLGAAAWPLVCAVVFAVYAFFPQKFPRDAGTTLYLVMVAEIPLFAVGALHAAALGKATVRARLTFFFVGLGVLALVVALHFGFKLDWLVVAPVMAWILMPFVFDLCSSHPDPELASRQAAAIVEDKGHLLALSPSLVIGAVLLVLATIVVLMGISIAIGTDLLGKLDGMVREENLSLLALLGCAYQLVFAASAAHVHRPVFLRHRRRLLDRPWLVKLTMQKKDR
jgi:hypothetical protein